MLSDRHSDDALRYEDGRGRVRVLKGVLDDATNTLVPVTAEEPARQIVVMTASDTPASVAANTSQEEAMTFTGVLTTDLPLQVIPPSAHPAGVSQGEVRVSATNTIQVRFENTTAGALSPAAGTYTLILLR